MWGGVFFFLFVWMAAGHDAPAASVDRGMMARARGPCGRGGRCWSRCRPSRSDSPRYVRVRTDGDCPLWEAGSLTAILVIFVCVFFFLAVPALPACPFCCPGRPVLWVGAWRWWRRVWVRRRRRRRRPDGACAAGGQGVRDGGARRGEAAAHPKGQGTVSLSAGAAEGGGGWLCPALRTLRWAGGAMWTS